MSSSPHSRTDVTRYSHHEPPISKLPPDVLWNIFRMNADMNDDKVIDLSRIHRPPVLSDQRALTSTRIASQVCALWRQILLASPSIWGRLIDLAFFAWICGSERHNYWAREVIRRSQDCPLHIKGEVGAWMAEFVGDLLDNSWERICILDVRIGRLLNPNLYKLVYRLQDIVSRPAKTLQFFRIDVQSNGGIDRHLMKARGDDGDRRLFSGEAPALKVYCHWPQFSRSLSVTNARALSNIHTFSLLDREIKFSSSHFLRVLRGMPLLETLRIWYFHFIFDHEWDGTSANRVKLPLLNKIEFYNNNMGQLTKLMGSFDPAPGCAIQVDTQFPGQFLGVPQWRDIFQDSMSILSQYGASYFKHHPPSSLDLVLQPDCLGFSDTTDSILPDSRLEVFMRARQSGEPLPTTKEMDLFFYPLTAHKDNAFFRSVKRLHMTLDNNAESFLNSDLSRALLELDGVETLAIREQDLGTMNSCFARITSSKTPFPGLRNLQFTELDLYNSSYGQSDYTSLNTEPWRNGSPLRIFLEHRRKMGVPIEVLDYNLCLGERRNLSFLEEEMNDIGLKIKWTSVAVSNTSSQNENPVTVYEEYVCGSGNPGKLEIWCMNAEYLSRCKSIS